MAQRVRRCKDDHRAARPSHSPLRHRRDRQRQLALQEPSRRPRNPRSPCLRNPGQLRRGERYRQNPPLKGVKIGRRSGVKFERRLTAVVRRCFQAVSLPPHTAHFSTAASRKQSSLECIFWKKRKAPQKAIEEKWAGWAGRADRGPRERGERRQAVVEVLEFLTNSSSATSSSDGLPHVCSRLRGRCWGGSVDDNGLISPWPVGWRIADAGSNKVVHTNTAVLHALGPHLAGRSGVRVPQ